VNLGIWFFGYWAGKEYSQISFDTIAQNFRKGWIIDTDPYWMNHFGHPYHGSLFYTAARSTGHDPYLSFVFASAGSLMWEQFLEKQAPALNDQVTTPGGGSVFGEVLYRMHRLILDSGGGRPGFWRRLGAFALAPMAGANELLFGDRYQGPALLPASWIGEFQVGMVIGGWLKDVQTGARLGNFGPWASIGAHITYGVPGTLDLRLRQPFDHFDFRGWFSFTTSEQPTASLLIRGLVVGDTLGPATGWGGLWGLFTSYDVIGVPLFKATGFGLGPGVSLVKRWDAFALYGTVVVEILPWAGGGSIEKLFDRDYHYGPGTLGVIDLRGIVSDRVTFDLSVREYWISGAYATNRSEDVTWSRAALTVRLYGPHGITASLDFARRRSTYPSNPDIHQRGAIAMAQYTLLQGW